jgi:hyperosmotically inducible periplasmic protein
MQNGYRHNQSLRIIVISTLLSTAFAAASVQAVAFGVMDDQAEASLTADFQKLDLDRDGKLSKAEITRDKDISKETLVQFQSIDSNHDGSLTSDEYYRYKSELQQARLQAYIDDSTITAKIKAELIKEVGLQSLEISVETHKGDVILSGFVESEDQAYRALEIASGIRGTQSIKNALVVKG